VTEKQSARMASLLSKVKLLRAVPRFSAPCSFRTVVSFRNRFAIERSPSYKCAAHISPCRLASTDADAGDSGTASADYYQLDPSNTKITFGDFSLMASQGETGRRFADVERIGLTGGAGIGDVVWIRGRVSSVRAKGNALFLVIRTGTFHTVQACHFKDKSDPEESKKMMKYASNLSLESIVDIMGTIATADVKSCSLSTVELHIQKVST
jgi:lysyl-tRNA synthetase class II